MTGIKGDISLSYVVVLYGTCWDSTLLQLRTAGCNSVGVSFANAVRNILSMSHHIMPVHNLPFLLLTLSCAHRHCTCHSNLI